MPSNSTLVEFDSQYRRRWMFPRNIRKIPPWKIAQILNIFENVITHGEWDQQSQNSFCANLVEAGLKSDYIPYDPNSGGSRTYYSQMKMLGLIYDSSTGIKFTIAGEDILSGKAPLPIMQRQLLSLQYPSPYSLAPNVKIHPGIKIKPLVFVFMLLRDPDIQSMTVNELQIPLIYGHNYDCFDICKEKILALRGGTSIEDVIDNHYEDLYTRRTAGNPICNLLSGMKDDANTCKNWLQSNSLITADKIEGIEVYQENTQYSDLITESINRRNAIINPANGEESFQRSFGAWNRSRDTRNQNQSTTGRRIDVQETLILSQFYEYCGTNLVFNNPDTFIDSLSETHGFERQKITDVISGKLPNAASYFQSTYHELSIGGRNAALAFEKATSELYRKLHFTAIETGQRRRPVGTIGGYSDIFLISYDDRSCAIVDTKASPSYSLGHDDILKMATTYIPSYTELITDGTPRDLAFVSYVAGGFSGNISRGLAEITSRCDNVGASAIKAGELFAIVQEGTSAGYQNQMIETFKSNNILTSNNFI